MKCHIGGNHRPAAELATEYDLDQDELAIICGSGRNQWDQLAEQFPDPQVEQKIEAEWAGSLMLTGSPDVFSLLEGLQEIRIGDWKSGFKLDQDHTDQMLGYAAILLDLYPWADRVVLCIIRVREGAAYWETYERSQVEQWLGRTIKRLQQTDEFVTGRHCAYCQRGHECPAKTSLMQQSAQALLGNTFANLPADPIERADFLGKLKDAAAFAKKVCDEVAPLIRAEVVAAGGAMRLSDGRELFIKTIEKQEISLKDGQKILGEALGGRLAECCKVSKTAVEKVVKDDAPRGMKVKFWDDLMERLDQAGAVNVKLEQRLETRRVPLAIAK